MPEVALCFTKQASDLEEAKKWGQEAKKWGQSRLFSEEMGSESIIWADAGQQRCRRAAINSTLTPIRPDPIRPRYLSKAGEALRMAAE